jgi:hypothetical protein
MVRMTLERYGVPATGRERLAACQPAHGEPAAVQRAEPEDRLPGVLAAARCEPAPLPEQRTDQRLVRPDRFPQGTRGQPRLPATLRCQGPTPSRSRALSMSAARSAELATAAGGSARTTVSDPAGSADHRAAITCRSRRRTWLRTTAFPTALLVTKPILAGPVAGCSLAGRRWTTTSGRPERRPPRRAAAKSCERVSLARPGNIGSRV